MALLLGVASCGGKVARLVRKGDFEGAIVQAESKRRTPRGHAARAYATALSEKERHDQARSVLMVDYRHGGDLRSLVALADLEHRLGLDGIAASHYGRAADLGLESLAGRDDVCALLRRRAAVWAAEGAGLAAERDLVRARQLCGLPSEQGELARLQQLEEKVDRSAQDEVDARVGRNECDTADCDQNETSSSVDALTRARSRGPHALRRTAARLRVEVPAEDVATILAAELRGAAGTAMMSDDEVRQLVGDKRWSDLAPSVMSRPPEVASYLQLRLASVVSDVPVTLRSRTGPGELDMWLAQSLEVTDEHSWRMLGWAGDMAAAELALGSHWRPKRRAAVRADADGAAGDTTTTPEAAGSSESEPSEPKAIDGIPPANHWTSRVAPTSENLFALLLEGRLRHAAGQERTGLKIHRYVAARAHEAGLEDIDRRVAEEAGWHLAGGRPWQALAIATVVPGLHSERAASAAATALRLARALCGGPCNDDADRDLVERVIGESWVKEQEQQRVSLSRRRSRPVGPLDACPTLGELLAPDAQGRLAEALAGARGDAGAQGQGRRLRAAIEADLGLGCAGRFVVPLLLDGGYEDHAGALADLLSHDAVLDSPRALTVHAALAMVAGHEQQSSLLATAAGAVSQEPARTWRDLARHAHATGQRELALRSLREALMHTPGLDDPSLHRAMVIASLSGIGSDWNLREAPGGAAEPASHIVDLLDRVEPARRYAAREDLAMALAEQPWLDADARQRLAPALWPDLDTERTHWIGRAFVDQASGQPLDLEPADVGPLDLAAQRLLVMTRKRSRPLPATVVFLDPSAMEGLRLALAQHSREWVLRWRTAIGLATWGTPNYRARAMAVLLEMAEPSQRAALVDVLLEAPTVVEPSAEGPLEAPLLASPEDELTVVFSLPFDPLGL